MAIDRKRSTLSCRFPQTKGQTGASYMGLGDFLAVFLARDPLGLIAQTFGR